MRPPVNMGTAHRLLYVVIGVALVVLPFLMQLEPSALRWGLPVVGLISLLSGSTGL